MLEVRGFLPDALAVPSLQQAVYVTAIYSCGREEPVANVTARFLNRAGARSLLRAAIKLRAAVLFKQHGLARCIAPPFAKPWLLKV
jgi:hypothetical protein